MILWSLLKHCFILDYPVRKEGHSTIGYFSAFSLGGKRNGVGAKL